MFSHQPSLDIGHSAHARSLALCYQCASGIGIIVGTQGVIIGEYEICLIEESDFPLYTICRYGINDKNIITDNLSCDNIIMIIEKIILRNDRSTTTVLVTGRRLQYCNK